MQDNEIDGEKYCGDVEGAVCREGTKEYWEYFDEFADKYNELIIEMGVSEIKLLNETIKAYYKYKIATM